MPDGGDQPAADVHAAQLVHGGALLEELEEAGVLLHHLAVSFAGDLQATRYRLRCQLAITPHSMQW